jgi:putative ABC transport system permease protein
MNPASIPRLDQVHLDLGALAFTAAVSILTGVVFGLAPARGALKMELTEALKEGAHGASPGRSHHRFHNLLVGAEVGISLLLLIGACLLIRSFAQLENVKPGFDPADVLSMQVSLPIPGPNDPERAARFFGQLLDRLQALPGVEHAALISELPLSGQENDTYFTIEGRPPLTPGNRPDEDARIISADFFRTMSIPLFQGRVFSNADNQKAGRVAIVSLSFARRYFPGQNPIGQHLNIDFGINFHCEIVGVVGDVRHRSIAGTPAPTMYVPYSQREFTRANVVICSRTPRLALVNEVKHEVQALDKNIPVYDIHAMDELVSGSVAEPRFRMLLLGSFAALALILAAGGIYGVMSYSVTRRTREIGLRMALGAGPRDIIKLTLGEGLLWVLGGAAIGLAAAFVLARLITSMLYEVRPQDPWSFLGMPAILLAVAVTAGAIPARRATKVDPMVSLRTE